MITICVFKLITAIRGIGLTSSHQVYSYKNSNKRHVVSKKYTRRSGSTNLSNSRLVQIVCCFFKMLGGLLCRLFVLLQVGDGDVGFLSCVEG